MRCDGRRSSPAEHWNEAPRSVEGALFDASVMEAKRRLLGLRAVGSHFVWDWRRRSPLARAAARNPNAVRLLQKSGRTKSLICEPRAAAATLKGQPNDYFVAMPSLLMRNGVAPRKRGHRLARATAAF